MFFMQFNLRFDDSIDEMRLVTEEFCDLRMKFSSENSKVVPFQGVLRVDGLAYNSFALLLQIRYIKFVG